MRLNEIKLFKDPSDEKFSDAFARFVKERGLGASEGGQAKVVWIEGKGWIWRAWFNDPGFERFLEYVQQHPGNPHLPKILSKVREEPVSFKRLPKDMKIKYVKIEKLSPLANDNNLLAGINFAPAAENMETFDEFAKYLSQFADAKKGLEANKEFFQLVYDLVKNHDANDINDMNVMMRGNTPVITDPHKD